MHVEDCKRLILENISKSTDEVSIYDFKLYRDVALSKEAVLEIDSFYEETLKLSNIKALNPFDFDYSINQLDEFCKKVRRERDSFLTHRAFARKIDNEKLVGLLSQCSAAQIGDIRGLYLTIYSYSNIDEFFMDDKDTLMDLKNRLCELQKTVESFDKIQLLQLQWFIENLDDILTKLHV